MSDKEVDFKSLVARMQTGERDYIARIETKGAEFKEAQSLFVKSIDEAKRQIEAVVSTADLDRYDEIIEPEAFRETLGIYLKNPIVISSHQNRLDTGHSSVVGQVIKAWINAKGLHVIIWFAETELGNEFWYLYKNKFQRAFSVGFIPLEWKDETKDGRRVRIHIKVELLEISCVPVPANRNALSKSKQRKADFVAEKIAQRQQLEKNAEDYAILTFGEDEYNKFMTGDGLDALEPDDAEAEFDETEFTGETELGFEPDYSSYFEN
ncbi:MAG: HK97 family phage prohead protease [Phycisphaerae bacterium]|nr:HK97 family phage prohead protease [Phycisphaerae bacterium]MDD5381270.1 HK97 family phage prohead protease [Phycisphaerae bacterium]